MAAYSSDEAEDAMAMAASTPVDMNESFTKEFLSCSICWEMYDDKARQPKLLSCHHTFCKGCLKKLQRGRSVIQCSTCRKDTLIPEGISSLQTNFYVMYMKQKFGEQLRTNHNVCYKHALQPLSFFCKTCTIMVCRDCIVLAHQQGEGHELQELTEVKAEYVLTLEQLRLKIDNTLRERQDLLSCLRAELDTMDIVSMVANKEIDAFFDQLVEMVNGRRQQMKDLLQDTHETRHRVVNEQLVDLDNQTTQLLVIREQLDEATCKGHLRDLVDVATDKQLREQIGILTCKQVGNLGKNYFKFDMADIDESFQNMLLNVGEFRDMSMLPSRLSIEAEDAVACLSTQIILKVATQSNDSLPRFPISMEIVDPTGEEILSKTTDNHDGTYTVAFTPQISGAHLCTVKFLGQKIPSSCLTIAVHSNDPQMVIGSMGKDMGKLMYPCSLKIGHDNTIYVVDEGNQRVQKIRDDNTATIESISVAGQTKTARTFDCAIDTAADELVCSKVLVEQRKAWADTIMIYSMEGLLKSQFTNPDMKKALYVAVNSAQEIIVTDYHLNTLFIYDHQGTLIRRIGQSGSGPGDFKEPAFVCIGRDDDIIVSDCRNSRIQVLNKRGDFKYQIGCKGTGKGQLQGPSGVTTDKHGHILVTDRINNRIQIYTYEGKFVSCIESTGNKLSDPRGLAVSEDGHVYVADQKNHCIKKYRYM